MTTILLKFFAVSSLLFLVACLILSIMLIRQKKKSEQDLDLFSQELDCFLPFSHWSRFTDGSYAIPTYCKLYKEESGSYVSVGTVAEHLEDFSCQTREDILENYFYGDIKNRSCIQVKFLSVDTRTNAVIISSISGKQFCIMRNEQEAFPECIKISFEKQQDS